MDFISKIKQPEGRKLEFKEQLPSNTDLAKTIISFANDAGGELFIGVKNEPRDITGVLEKDLDVIEGRISNLTNDLCEPVILPEISYINVGGKKIIRVYIHKGFKPPYFLKNKGKDQGTFIRVGSSNRLASPEIIADLERQGQNTSYDAEIVFGTDYEKLDIREFSELYLEKTSENLSKQVLLKLNLLTELQGKLLPTNALVLLSNSALREKLFPYAKIECARFKGNKPGIFIDSKTIDCNVSNQAEEAFNFIKRHVNIGTVDYKGVYHNQRWEYPIIALREVIRNAVIHRDYSLTGKDIKIAVFDDKIEITSPGRLMPSVDYSLMDAGQSDVRNKILAPVFKKLGIIEQWGNGLQLIDSDLKDYPELELNWTEPGLSFRVSFIKKNYSQQPELQPELQPESQLESQLELKEKAELGAELEAELRAELNSRTDFSKILAVIFSNQSSAGEISIKLGKLTVTGSLKRAINKLLDHQLIERTIPDKPNSRNQKYKITNKGITFLKLLDNKTK